MKKILDRLLVFGLGVATLSGCDFFSTSGESEEGATGIDVRNYKTAAVLNSTYEFTGDVLLVFEDGREKEVTNKATYTTLDTSKLGDSTFKVSYESTKYIFSKILHVNIIESIQLTSIEIIDYSSTVKVNEAYTFDGKVTAKYNDGTTVDVTNKAVVSTIDTSSIGEKILVVSYTDGSVTKSAQTAINVTRELTGISISGYQSHFEQSDDKTYAFNGTIYAEYSDNFKKDVTNLTDTIIDSSAVDLSTLGEYDLKVSYTEDGKTFEASVKISVTAHIPVLQSIAASNYSTAVDKDETYVFNGKVMAHFDVGDDVDVTAACVFGTISTSSTGTKSLSISYTDPNNSSIKKSTSVSITVISHVTGVSVDAASLNVGVGRSGTFTPTVLPSDATNKGVTVTSSDSNIAKVGSSTATSGNTVTVTGVAVGTATITVASVEDPTKTASVTVNVSEVTTDYEWTILMYICGADLESDSTQGGQATADIAEILSVSGQPSDVNIVMQTGGASSWKKYGISSSYNQRYQVKNKSLTSVNSKVYSSYKGMGEKSTLQDFLEWGISTYSSEKYGVIFWNHGGGLEGVCYDEKDGDDPLTNDEVKSAVSNAITSTGVGKLEFVGYDACLMQVAEIADFNAPYFNYQIASQESENGTGWDYDTWIDDLYAKKDTPTILKAIVDGFIKDNGGVDAEAEYYSGYGWYYPNQTLSYLDLNQASAFKTAWESLGSALSNKITSSNKSSFKTNVLEKIKTFADDDWERFAQFDCYDLLAKLEANSTFNPGSSYITAARTALDNYVKYSVSQTSAAADAHGLCFYFGSTYNSSTYSNFSNWRSLISTVGGYSSGGGWW